MSHKLLIVTDLFPPAFGPRMGYLCKYLGESNWSPVVITENIREERFAGFESFCPVYRFDYYRQGKKNLWKRFSGAFLGAKDKILTDLGTQLLEKETFDLILCSTFRTFPLQTAYKLSKKQNIPLIVDLRDIIEQYSGYELLGSLTGNSIIDKLLTRLLASKELSIRNKILKEAAAVTTVSSWHQQTLSKINPHTHLIYNGYDPELFYPHHLPSSKFSICYTGRVQSIDLRNPIPLFEAIKLLEKSERLTPERFCVQWYTDSESADIIKKAAQDFQVEQFMDFCGYVPAKEVPKVLNSSSILLMLTNEERNGKGPQGIMTTKLFEALAVQKPILCVPNDAGGIEKVLAETKSGIASSSPEVIAEFIKKYMKQYYIEGVTQAYSEEDQVRKYSRSLQAKQFVTIFDAVIQT